MTRLIFIMALGVALTGCGGEQSPPSTDQRILVATAQTPAPLTVTNGVAAPEALTAPRTNAAKPASTIPIYELRMSAADLRAMDLNPGSDQTYHGTFRAEGETFEDVQVRYRGQWARTWPKKPFKIFFPRDKPFQGHHSINLNSAWRDPAMVRETLAYRVFAACGVPASRSRMVQLRVNDKFHGLYAEVEQVDKTFLRRFHLEGAALFKAASPNNQSDERDFPSLRSFLRHYENETARTNDVELLQRFCHELATTGNVLEFFNQQVDVDEYINYLAGCALTQHWDGFNKNHFLVRHSRGGGKWLVVPWDLDRTLGDHWHGGFDTVDLPLLLGTRPLPGPTGWNRLQDHFFNEPVLRDRFLKRLKLLLETEFTEAKLYPMLDQFSADLAAVAMQDRRLWSGPGETLQSGIAELKRFIRDRRASLWKELAQFSPKNQ